MHAGRRIVPVEQGVSEAEILSFSKNILKDHSKTILKRQNKIFEFKSTENHRKNVL